MAVTVLAASWGCRPRKAAAPVRRRIVVETYPPPIDLTKVRRQLPPPPEPELIKNGEKTALLYHCRGAKSELLRDAVSGLISPEGSVQASPRLNALIITEANDKVQGILKFLKKIDKPVPQLLVEARIIEVTLDSDLEYEINHDFYHKTGGSSAFLKNSNVKLSTPGSSPNTTQGSLLNVMTWQQNTERLDAFIRLLLTKGKARILSSPNLIVTAGDQASIITGEEVPVQSSTVTGGSVTTSTTFKRVGIKLRVTPQQIIGDTARMEINPEVSTVTGFTSGPSGTSSPIVAIRNVRTTLAMKDGEILTIAGLLRSEERRVIRKVPGLGRVPVLGLLFQSRRQETVKTQLVFFLRVNILAEGKPRTIRVHKPGKGLDLLDEEVTGAEEAGKGPAKK
jgi:type II secretory pathway component GspD/PulD (secretin)